jgi:hypothetical protein
MEFAANVIISRGSGFVNCHCLHLHRDTVHATTAAKGQRCWNIARDSSVPHQGVQVTPKLCATRM